MKAQEISNQVLLKQYVEGNEHALEQLIEKHKDTVYTAIFMFVKDGYVSEGIFQDTFMAVIDEMKSGEFDMEQEFIVAVMKTANRLCREHALRMNQNVTITDSEGFELFDTMKFAEQNLEGHLSEIEVKRNERKLINQLPAEQKEVIVMRHYADLSFEEIAELTKTTVETVMARMRYALLNLRNFTDAQAFTS